MILCLQPVNGFLFPGGGAVSRRCSVIKSWLSRRCARGAPIGPPLGDGIRGAGALGTEPGRTGLVKRRRMSHHAKTSAATPTKSARTALIGLQICR